MFRKNKKMTRITRHTVSTRVNLTSSTDSLMDTERSIITSRLTEAGNWFLNEGMRASTASTTATVLTPGWRCTASTKPGWPLYQLRRLFCSTESTAWPTSLRRTGEPLR